MPLVRSTPVTSGFASRDIYGTGTSLCPTTGWPTREIGVRMIRAAHEAGVRRLSASRCDESGFVGKHDGLDTIAEAELG